MVSIKGAQQAVASLGGGLGCVHPAVGPSWPWPHRRWLSSQRRLLSCNSCRTEIRMNLCLHVPQHLAPGGNQRQLRRPASITSWLEWSAKRPQGAEVRRVVLYEQTALLTSAKRPDRQHVESYLVRDDVAIMDGREDTAVR